MNRWLRWKPSWKHLYPLRIRLLEKKWSLPALTVPKVPASSVNGRFTGQMLVCDKVPLGGYGWGLAVFTSGCATLLRFGVIFSKIFRALHALWFLGLLETVVLCMLFMPLCGRRVQCLWNEMNDRIKELKSFYHKTQRVIVADMEVYHSGVSSSQELVVKLQRV